MLSGTYRHPGAISVASRCALIVFFRTMFPCSLSRLWVISLPLPCSPREEDLPSKHVRLGPRRDVVGSGQKNQNRTREGKKKKNQNKKRLKWKRCHSCPRLHPRKKKKTCWCSVGSVSAHYNPYSPLGRKRTGCKSANPSAITIILKKPKPKKPKTNQDPDRWVSPRNQFKENWE